MNQNLAIPAAIVIAGMMIAGSIIFINQPPSGSTANNGQDQQQAPQLERPRSIGNNDHVRGDPNASVVIIEYSDTECAFCKRFHNTMHDIITEFNGDIAWVYRHFPIPSLHAKAEAEAHAAECVAELGGNDAFWTFIDTIYEQTPSNDGLDLGLLPEFATQAGVDRAAFTECQESSRHMDRIRADRDEAVAAGGRGTPYSVAITEDEMIPINGAQPIENVRAIVNKVLGNAGS